MSDTVLDIFIGIDDNSPGQTGRLAEFTALRRSIAALPVVQVRSGTLVSGPGTKASNAIDITHLIVTLVPSAAIIAGITHICVERIKAGAARELHLRIGENEVRLSGVDPEEQARALEQWSQAVLDDGTAE